MWNTPCVWRCGDISSRDSATVDCTPLVDCTRYNPLDQGYGRCLGYTGHRIYAWLIQCSGTQFVLCQSKVGGLKDLIF